MVDDLRHGELGECMADQGLQTLEVATTQTWPSLDESICHVSQVGVLCGVGRVSLSR